MNDQDLKLLKDAGWTVECESPLEIRKGESFATLEAACTIVYHLRDQIIFEEKNAALMRYGKHERDCNYSHISKSDCRKFTPCTCGLHDQLYGKRPE